MKKVEKISFDIDGTLTILEAGSRMVRFLPTLILVLLLFVLPRFSAVRRLREYKAAGRKIILVSCRPDIAWVNRITMIWLCLWRIPFDELYLTGPGHKGKLEVIKKICATKHYDNSRNFSRFCEMAGVQCKIL